MFDAYAKLIRLRNVPNFSPTFVSSDITYNLSGAFKWIKVNSDSLKLFVIGNFDVVPATTSVAFQNAGTWYNYMTGGTRTATGSAESITLQPGEYYVYTNRDANNFVTTSVRNTDNAYPNPVNSIATIEYDLPESGKVNVSVFNNVGQQMGTLFNGFKPRGTQKLSVGSSTHKLSNGNYLLKIEVNGKVKVQQFVVQH